MAADDKVATWSLKIDANAKDVDATRASLEQLKAAIAGSQTSIAGLNQVYRSLKGSSDEVKSAKVQLKAAIDAERAGITQATLGALKQGVALEALTAKTKHATDAAGSLGKSVRSIGGPVAEVSEKVGGLKEVLAGAATGWGALAIGATAAVAVLAIATTAILGATAALIRWIFESGSANRTAALLREGWTGTAESGLHLRNQIDALANKVPLAREKLQELAGASVKALSGTRVSGQGIVDTFAAVATASAAMGEEVGGQLKAIVDRAKNFGRVQISPFELQGSGIRRDDIAFQIGKLTGKSVAEARAALAEGRVEVNLFAAALRKAAEVRFGDNLKKRMIDTEVVTMRLKEGLSKLTEDIDFSPLNAMAETLSHSLDKSTITGKAAHDVITAMGDAIVRMIGGSGDATTAIVKFETYAIKGATQVVLALLFVKKHWDGIKLSVLLAKEAVVGFVQAVIGLIPGLGPLFRLAQALGAIGDAKKAILGGGEGPASAAGTGGAPVVAPVAGHASGGVIPKPAAGEVFVSAAPGETIVPAGMALGPAGGAPEPSAEPRRGGGAGGAPPGVTVHVHIDASGHAQAKDVVQGLSSATFLANLTKAVEDALVGLGLPVQSGPSRS